MRRLRCNRYFSVATFVISGLLIGGNAYSTQQQFDGVWKGNFSCGPLLTGGGGQDFSHAATMTVSSGEAVFTRETAKILEEAKGKVSSNNSLVLSGGGGYKSENYQPWKTSITGQINGNRFMGSGAILGMDGSKLRECSVDLTLVSSQAVAGTAKPQEIIKATELQPKSSASWPISKTYEEISTLADGRVGKIAYKTLARTTTLGDVKQGRLFMTDTAQAILTLPDTGSAPYPIMVIAHSSAGVQNKDHDWARWFNQQGIATLVVDTFTPRGITHSASDQSVLYYGATVGEYLIALKLLATHPAIDIKRAGIIGFSRGGVAAMATAIDSVRQGVVGSKLKYSVHFPVYGGCNYRAQRWTGAPVHLFVGTEDSYEDMDVCRGWQEHARSTGIDAKITVLPGVYHGFDNSAQPNLRIFPEAEYWKDCKVEWNIDSNQFRSAQHSYWHSDNTLVQETSSCKKRGVSVKYDESATNSVKEEVAKQLRALGFI